MGLSDAAKSLWGKSWPMRGGPIEGWAPLWRHMQDTAAVAGRLWDEWLPTSLRRLVAERCGGDDAGRTLLTFLAGVHDIGKATPAFAIQVDTLRDEVVKAGLPIAQKLPERATRPHSLAGQVILERWLTTRYGWTPGEGATLGSVIGGHHGIPPSQGERAAARAPLMVNGGPTSNGLLLGTGPWLATQDELLDHIAQRTGAPAYLAADTWRRLPGPVLALALGVVVVADWLASNIDLFPLTPVTGTRLLAQPGDEDEARLIAAWNAVNLPSPWEPAEPSVTSDSLLADRFGLPPAAGLRPVQRAVVEAAQEMVGAGILVVEAPMGEGKTEAAILAAEVLAARTGAAGVLVALPTQATTDAMFARVMRWISRLPPTTKGAAIVPDGDARSAVRRSVYLAHGKAWLNPGFDAVPRSRTPVVDVGRDADDSTPARGWRVGAAERGGPYVDAWMSGRRKGVLADFVVGTIDQVLFSALQSRHVALRHLALARKVVVLDEIHSFDAYMNVYLERALEWLGAYRVPVIALSATLPTALRTRLVSAYRRGLHGDGGRRHRRGRRAWAARAALADATSSVSTALGDAPASEASGQRSSSLVTCAWADGEITRPVNASSRSLTVHLETLPDDLPALSELLTTRTAGGGCVLVVRNTVRRAQETYEALAKEFGDDLVLLHSRFLASDRKNREKGLVTELGPPPRDGTRAARPPRRIVVGTQVVEQSLDIDADLLVTDLAPTDLLLQRIGRLHRHDRSADHRPPALRKARTVVVGVEDWTTAPPSLPRGSIAVYGEYALYRAAAQVLAITARDGLIELPTDIAPLVQEAYDDDATVVPSAWQERMAQARLIADGKRAEAERRGGTFRLPAPFTGEPGLVGWLDASVGEADVSEARAQVRDGEDSIEVLVVQEDATGQWYLPPWLPGWADATEEERALPKDVIPSKRHRRALAGASLRLPRSVAGGRRGDDVVTYLESLIVEPWQLSRDLAGQLVLPLDPAARASVPGATLWYDPAAGLRYEVER